jgi:hypothetical protein
VSSNLALAGVSTGFTVGSHVIMSLLLIVRQGWLAAAGQACGFILTLNPFEALMPIPQGIVGLFVLSVGFIAYVLIAASGALCLLVCVRAVVCVWLSKTCVHNAPAPLCCAHSSSSTGGAAPLAALCGASPPSVHAAAPHSAITTAPAHS